MVFVEWQLWFDMWWGKTVSQVYVFKELIIDRGSKYTTTIIPIIAKEEVKQYFHNLKKDSFYANAAHNSYAFRFSDNGSIIEGKNDDGETWAGMCILREIQRAEYINCMVVVTRYFGGVMLYNDRFKHVIDAVKIGFERIEK